MSKRGAPAGNKNAAHGKPWTDALRRALAQFEDDSIGVQRGGALVKIAENVVKIACIAPDKDVIKEIGERLDGKAKQSIDLEGKLTVKPEVDMAILKSLK